MAYLTPDELPEERDCRALSIPASTDWLAIVSGALTELTKPYNWQQQGAVTVDEAVAAMQEMIDAYYEGCNDCVLPEGGSIIRINFEGKVEVLTGDEWVVPTEGDYYIPPPEAREGGTPDDQICLAAKNAVNVLHEVYLNLSESFEGELDDTAAGISMVGVIATIVGVIVGSIAAGILALGLFGFNLLYQALSYLTADLWTEDFDAQITCFLVECGSNSAGVVTFDWQCFNDKLNSLADDFSLSEVQIRLYLQIGFILQFIGGVGGLNLAGATSEISDDDCSFCDDVWCFTWDFETSQGDWELYPAANGSYDTGVGFVAGDVVRGVQRTLVDILIDFDSTVITGIGFVYEWSAGTEQTGIQALQIAANGLTMNLAEELMPFVPPDPPQLTWTGEETMTDIYILAQCSINAYGGSAVIKSVTINGKGECPFGTPNC